MIPRTLSPKQLGQAIGASESSLKRWVDEGLLKASKTAGGHRRIAIEEAIRFIRERGLPIVKPQVLGLAELDAVAEDTERSQDAPESAAARKPRPKREDQVEVLYEMLRSGDSERARGIILASFLDGEPIASVCDTLIAPAMRQIGLLWKHSREGIFREHRATDICLAALSQIRTLIPSPDSDKLGLTAVGGAPDGDPYTLPSLMVATTLASLGIGVHHLGADVPADVMIEAVNNTDADIAWVSISVETPIEVTARYIDALAESLAARDAMLLAGGRAFPADLHPHQANVQVSRNMSELAAFANGFKRAAAAKPKRE